MSGGPPAETHGSVLAGVVSRGQGSVAGNTTAVVVHSSFVVVNTSHFAAVGYNLFVKGDH